MNESELSDKIAEVFYTYAEEVQHLDQQELIELTIFLQKIRADIESGRYDNETKKWSELEWRA